MTPSAIFPEEEGERRDELAPIQAGQSDAPATRRRLDFELGILIDDRIDGARFEQSAPGGRHLVITTVEATGAMNRRVLKPR